MEIEITQNVQIGTPCLICGETVKIFHPSDTPQICGECKRAVMEVRGLLTELKTAKADGRFPYAAD